MRDLDEPPDPGDAGEVPVHHEQSALGEHPGVLAQRPVQQGLLGFGLVPAGRASTMSCSSRAGSGPAASRQHRVRRHRGRHVPGHQGQVTEQGGQNLPVAGLRHQRHQQRRPQRRRHRHRPPGSALDLPPRNHPRRDLADHAGLPGHRIQLLLDDPEPGVVSGMTSCLDPPVAAHHRRGDRQRETTRQGTKARGTPGTRRGVSNHFSYRESLPKARNHGQKPPPRVAPQATCASTAAARLIATARTPIE